jgi:hypothetical protein
MFIFQKKEYLSTLFSQKIKIHALFSIFLRKYPNEIHKTFRYLIDFKNTLLVAFTANR